MPQAAPRSATETPWKPRSANRSPRWQDLLAPAGHASQGSGGRLTTANLGPTPLLTRSPYARGDEGARRRPARAAGRGPRGRLGVRPRRSTLDRGKLLVRDRVDRLLDPGSPFLELSPLAATGMYAAHGRAGRRPGGRHRHRHRPGRRPRVRRGRQRRDGQGRHLLPDDGQEAPARAGGGAGPTGCRASTSSTPAARSCRCRTRCSPTGSTSAGSSSTRPTCRRAGIPQIAAVMGSCTAGGAYVPAMSDETRDRQGPGHDLPRRPAAGEGRDRRGRHRRGARRRRRARPQVRRGRPPRRGRRARAGDRPLDRGHLRTTPRAPRLEQHEPEEPAEDPAGPVRRRCRPTRARRTTSAR